MIKLYKGIIFFGGPGSGKGTIIDNIRNSEITSKLGYKVMPLIHISTGQILRDEIKNETDAGLEALSYIKKGELVPDKQITDVLTSYIQQNSESYQNHIIGFDGFPRTISQADKLSKLVDILAVLYNEVPHQVMVQRMESRYKQDPSRGKEDNIKRIIEFQDKTKPLLEFYDNLGLLKTVDGTKTPLDVAKQTLEVLQPFY